MLKSIFIFIGILAVAFIMWVSVSEQKKSEFRNNLPEEVTADTSKEVPRFKVIPQENTILPRIPLPDGNKFELNTNFEQQLKELHRLTFIEYKLLSLRPEELSQYPFTKLDAASLIQLHAYIQKHGEENKNLQESSVLFLGTLLESEKERSYFIQRYLIDQELWRPLMKKIHWMLMEQPANSTLNASYLAMLAPANKELIIDYMRDVQFLYRRPGDEYFEVTPKIMNRFSKTVLTKLLDKVDDYSWWAAYPEKDAADALREMLEEK